MTATTLSLVLILAQTAVGVHGHDGPTSATCDACGEKPCKVSALLIRLQTSRRGETREDAAHDLRKVDWRTHPEVLGALAYTLLHDPDEEVREEAAESLVKMRAYVPVVHEALTLAATNDPDGPTRREARRGLRGDARPCSSPCRICGTTATPPVVVVPARLPVRDALAPAADAPGFWCPTDPAHGVDPPPS